MDGHLNSRFRRTIARRSTRTVRLKLTDTPDVTPTLRQSRSLPSSTFFPSLVNQIRAPTASHRNPSPYPGRGFCRKSQTLCSPNAKSTPIVATPNSRPACALPKDAPPSASMRFATASPLKPRSSPTKTVNSFRNCSTPFSPNTSPPDPPKPCSSSKWPWPPGAYAACALSKPVCSVSGCRNCPGTKTRPILIPVRALLRMTLPVPVPSNPFRATKPASNAHSTGRFTSSSASAPLRLPPLKTLRLHKVISQIKPNPKTGRPTLPLVRCILTVPIPGSPRIKRSVLCHSL